jgi:hypothetical protein
MTPDPEVHDRLLKALTGAQAELTSIMQLALQRKYYSGISKISDIAAYLEEKMREITNLQIPDFACGIAQDPSGEPSLQSSTRLGSARPAEFLRDDEAMLRLAPTGDGELYEQRAQLADVLDIAGEIKNHTRNRVFAMPKFLKAIGKKGHKPYKAYMTVNWLIQCGKIKKYRKGIYEVPTEITQTQLQQLWEELQVRE